MKPSRLLTNPAEPERVAQMLRLRRRCHVQAVVATVLTSAVGLGTFLVLNGAFGGSVMLHALTVFLVPGLTAVVARTMLARTTMLTFLDTGVALPGSALEGFDIDERATPDRLWRAAQLMNALEPGTTSYEKAREQAQLMLRFG